MFLGLKPRAQGFTFLLLVVSSVHLFPPLCPTVLPATSPVQEEAGSLLLTVTRTCTFILPPYAHKDGSFSGFTRGIFDMFAQ